MPGGALIPQEFKVMFLLLRKGRNVLEENFLEEFFSFIGKTWLAELSSGFLGNTFSKNCSKEQKEV